LLTLCQSTCCFSSHDSGHRSSVGRRESNRIKAIRTISTTTATLTPHSAMPLSTIRSALSNPPFSFSSLFLLLGTRSSQHDRSYEWLPVTFPLSACPFLDDRFDRSVPKDQKGPLDTFWKIRDSEGFILNNDGSRSSCVHQWDRFYAELYRWLDKTVADT
jgi:hypothetical protein